MKWPKTRMLNALISTSLSLICKVSKNEYLILIPALPKLIKYNPSDNAKVGQNRRHRRRQKINTSNEKDYCINRQTVKGNQSLTQDC